MDDQILSQLAQYIATQIIKQPTRTIAPTEPLISNGLVDSFSLVDLALFVEDRYGVLIDDTELNKETFDNLAQLADLIQSRME